MLPQETIQELETQQKIVQHISIGKMQGNHPEFGQLLSHGFANVRERFLTMNRIAENKLLCVKKDALFVVGDVQHTNFGFVQFVKKNAYSSYVRFTNNRNIEIFYNDDSIHVKGISDDTIDYHRLYILPLIKRIIKGIERKDKDIKRFLIKFIDRYKSGELEQEYYLEFNNKSKEVSIDFNYFNLLLPFVQIILKEV